MPMNCPHRATPLMLPYGGRIIGSGCFERTPDDVVPDFGLYAYDGWRPTWPAAFIDWPDFGLPEDTEETTRLIVDAFARVRKGELVEIGCHAGNGREMLAADVVASSDGEGSRPLPGTRSTGKNTRLLLGAARVGVRLGVTGMQAVGIERPAGSRVRRPRGSAHSGVRTGHRRRPGPTIRAVADPEKL